MRKSSGSCLVIAGAKFRTMASSDLPHQSTSPIRCAPGWLCEISFISSSWRASIGAVGGSAAVGWSSSVDAVDDAGADAATAGCADVAGTAQQRSPQPAVDVMMEPRRQRVWLERPDRGCVCLTRLHHLCGLWRLNPSCQRPVYVSPTSLPKKMPLRKLSSRTDGI